MPPLSTPVTVLLYSVRSEGV